MLMPLFAAALVVRRMYFIVSPRPFPAAPLVVRRRCLIVVPMPMPEVPRMYLIVVYTGRYSRRRSLCVACTWPWCQDKDRCLRP
jgi:hypothetical protein